MVLRLTSRSPRRSGLFVTVVCASSRRLDAGVEASGPHDFSVRVSAVRQPAPPASTASHPNVRDDRDTPLDPGRDGRGYRFDLGGRRREIFLEERLYVRANQWMEYFGAERLPST